MYVKYIRHRQLKGSLQRGKLYRVHFQPNEKGGYNERLHFISGVYEIPPADGLMPPLIYPAGVRKTDGRMRLVFGCGFRQSMLHLINPDSRDAFFIELRYALSRHEELRIEVTDQT